MLKHKYFLLFFLWAILTGININKAFHIDDTFYLEASEWIKNNPTKPMSGLINWFDDPTPIYSSSNQPPLFFYLIALFSSIFGTNEIPLHILISIFTFLVLYYFDRITRLLKIQNVNTLLILFAFCPAFILNQNLMTDIPVLALVLGAAYYLLKANRSPKIVYYSLSLLLLGLGLLIKYSILPLLVVLILVILIRREFKYLITLLIPLSMLFLWSLWNYIEYGSIHILDRPKGVIAINHLWAFIACLGSISTFSISFIMGLFPLKIIKGIVYFVLTTFMISVILFYYNLIAEEQYTRYLFALFMANGFIICISLIIRLRSYIKEKGLLEFIRSDSFTIFLFLSSISAFLVLFAPFMATRHILLIIPFILLFGHKLINKATTNINRLSLTITVILGLLLGISDWKYADYYRQMASSIDLPENRDVWTAGHWGWQWYSKKNGMKQYNMNQSNVNDGDYLVYPGDVDMQNINENINLILIEKKWQEANILTFFSGNNFASLYQSSVDKAPWILSKSPIDTIFICKIIKKEKLKTKN